MAGPMIEALKGIVGRVGFDNQYLQALKPKAWRRHHNKHGTHRLRKTPRSTAIRESNVGVADRETLCHEASCDSCQCPCADSRHVRCTEAPLAGVCDGGR